MLVLGVFAFVAGTLTILAPCTLPVVPLVLGASSTGGGRLRTTGILVGFGLAFVSTAVVLANVLASAGLTTDRLRVASAVVLGLVGLSLAANRVGAWAERRLSPVAGSRDQARRSPAGRRAGGRTRPGRGDRAGLGAVRGSDHGRRHRRGRHARPEPR